MSYKPNLNAHLAAAAAPLSQERLIDSDQGRKERGAPRRGPLLAAACKCAPDPGGEGGEEGAPARLSPALCTPSEAPSRADQLARSPWRRTSANR
ncbi:UNVERIFIED_CONTAM: hypothetical protein K2H54_009101 [Gekko kuhli]